MPYREAEFRQFLTEYQPVNTADTDEARAQNRRIELKLTEK